jgi:hypothetical protein
MYCNYRHQGCPFFMRLITDKAFEQRDEMIAHIIACPYRTIKEPETGERLLLGELDNFRQNMSSKILRRMHSRASPSPPKCTCCHQVQSEIDSMDSRVASMLRDSQIKPRQTAIRHNIEMAHSVHEVKGNLQEVKRKRERARKVAQAMEEQLLDEQRRAQEGFTTQMVQELVGLRRECAELRARLSGEGRPSPPTR